MERQHHRQTVIRHSGELDDNITTAITEYMAASISSPFRTSYVVRELQLKRAKSSISIAAAIVKNFQN